MSMNCLWMWRWSDENWADRLTRILQKWLYSVRKVALHQWCAPDPNLIKAVHCQNRQASIKCKYFVTWIYPLISKVHVTVIENLRNANQYIGYKASWMCPRHGNDWEWTLPTIMEDTTLPWLIVALNQKNFSQIMKSSLASCSKTS